VSGVCGVCVSGVCMGRYLHECAKALGYTAEWVRHLASTDLFQEELSKARESIMGEAKARLKEKVMNVAGESMDSIQERLEETRVDLTNPEKTVRAASERFQVDSATMALKALGYISNGTSPSPGSTTNIQINLDPEKVQAAREKLKEAGALPQDIQPFAEISMQPLLFKEDEVPSA